jgi:large subunit ribosomal protein L30
MIVVIRIAGQVNLSGDVKEALDRLRLRKKYSAVLLSESKETSKLLLGLRDFISYGKINTETLTNLIEERGMPLEPGKKIDTKKVLTEIDKKPLNKLGMKPFFRLHPPRKGIESKKHAGEIGKGVLGENQKINELIKRML